MIQINDSLLQFPQVEKFFFFSYGSLYVPRDMGRRMAQCVILLSETEEIAVLGNHNQD